MNPIIVIGLVSVVTAGMYATYDGLEKQAALAALHADMLAHTTYVSGTIEEKQHVIISNNGPQPAELIQVRAYDDTSALIDTWDMSYVLPPLQEFNMSSATMPAPPSDLTGSALENSLDNDNYYRGVTSAGAIFDIVLAPSSGTSTPDHAYGPMATMPLGGGGGTATHVSGQPYNVAYHYASYPFRCWDNLDVWGGRMITIVWDTPYRVSSDGNPGTPFPVGSSTWYHKTVNWHHPPMNALLCNTITPGLTPIPTNITPLVGYNNVYTNVLSVTGFPISISLPLSGNLVAPLDGDMLLRVDIPVNAEVDARYTATESFQCKHLWNSDSRMTSCTCIEGFASHMEAALRPLNDAASRPSDLEATIGIKKNGVPAGTIVLEGTPISSVDNRMSITSTNPTVCWQGACPYWGTCTTNMNGPIQGEFAYGEMLSGLVEIQVSAGDSITLSGDVELTYSSPSTLSGSADSTYGVIELGDAILSVGTQPP
ncbi:MAG: hypothetical protein J4F28_08315 [Nitrosopumilaceae archaeon]|nr:hypothetical protein [Nitrosopumilaceae archaeon]